MTTDIFRAAGREERVRRNTASSLARYQGTVKSLAGGVASGLRLPVRTTGTRWRKIGRSIAISRSRRSMKERWFCRTDVFIFARPTPIVTLRRRCA